MHHSSPWTVKKALKLWSTHPLCSFDIVKDQLGGPRRAFPHSMMLVTGTQAATARANYLALMRLSNLGQVPAMLGRPKVLVLLLACKL